MSRVWTPPVKKSVGFINVSVDSDVLVKYGIYLRQAPEKIKIAVSHAVNYTTEHFKSVAIRETVKTYFVKRKEIEKSITIQKSYGGRLHGLVISKGKRHSLADYKISPTSPRSNGRTLIKAAVKREGGLKPLAKKGKDGEPIAFLVKRAGGKYFLFYRTKYDSTTRQYGGIKSYLSPSIPQIMKNQQTVATAERGIDKVFEKRLLHDLGKEARMN